MRPSKKSNTGKTLEALAWEAWACHQRSQEYWFKTAAILVEAKKIADHGQWEAFLRRADIPARTASRMLRVRNADLKSATVADLGGVKGADAYLSWEKSMYAGPEGFKEHIRLRKLRGAPEDWDGDEWTLGRGELEQRCWEMRDFLLKLYIEAKQTGVDVGTLIAKTAENERMKTDGET